MKYFIILIFMVKTLLFAEFVTSFEDIPPVEETVLGSPVTIESTDENPVLLEPEEVLGEEITVDPNVPVIEDIPYKEVKVRDFARLGSLKVALLVPKKVIKGYAKKVSNSILSYLIYKGRNFTFEVFDSRDESEDRLLSTISKIKSRGYKYVIAPLTKDGARTLANLERDILIYVPTVNKNQVIDHYGNFYFGGINYKKQINKLFSYTNGKIAIFMDRSWLAQKLTSYIEEKSYDKYIYTKLIKSTKINPKYILKGNSRLQNASIFFNLPLITTAMIASSFSSYNIKPYRLFSTQVNYSPLLFTMIQRKDRQNFYIANSIDYVNSKLNDINQNLGIKIKYDWVAYSSSIGIDYILSNFYMMDPTFNEDMRSHQVAYRTKIEKIVHDEFVKVR